MRSNAQGRKPMRDRGNRSAHEKMQINSERRITMRVERCASVTVEPEPSPDVQCSQRRAGCRCAQVANGRIDQPLATLQRDHTHTNSLCLHVPEGHKAMQDLERTGRWAFPLPALPRQASPRRASQNADANRTGHDRFLGCDSEPHGLPKNRWSTVHGNRANGCGRPAPVHAMPASTVAKSNQLEIGNVWVPWVHCFYRHPVCQIMAPSHYGSRSGISSSSGSSSPSSSACGNISLSSGSIS